MSDRTFELEHLSVKNYDFSLERIKALGWNEDREEILEQIKERVSFDF